MTRTLGDVGTKLMFENERIRVWEVRIEPGQEGDVHRHDEDYVLVQISGDRIAVVPEPDSGGRFNQYLEADVAPGRFAYIEKGGVETARNVGERTYHEILIELKAEITA